MSIATEITRLQTAKANLKTAIEAKGVTVSSDAKLDAYPTLVDSIPSGGGSVTEKLVNFYDYEGTLVASYTGTEAQALTALPDAPDHSNDEIPLTFEGWNWTLEEVKEYNTNIPKAIINVGANYHTSDGANHTIVKVTDDYTFSFGVWAEQEMTFTVDWGDGTVETYNYEPSEDGFTVSHTYETFGKFHCILNGEGGEFGPIHYCCETWCYPQGTEFVYVDAKYISVPTSTTEVDVSHNFSLNYITIPRLATYNCSYATSLHHVSIPFSYPELLHDTFRSCTSLQSITLPHDITGFDDEALSYCHCLENLVFPDSVTALGQFTFEKDYNLRYIEIPNTVTSIGESCFQSCWRLFKVTIPESVTDIGRRAFYDDPNLEILIVNNPSPPTIQTSAFANSTLQHVYVPAESVETYKAATNWSSFADVIEAIPV